MQLTYFRFERSQANDLARTYWIVSDPERIGMIHIEDLGDGNPLFDLKLGATTPVDWEDGS